MKSRFLTSFTAITLFAALTMPLRLAAQQNPWSNKHRHYQFIDLGTFGGPISINQIGPALNNEGRVIGMADTNNPDPFYPNFNPLILPGGASDPYIFRAFGSNNGELLALDSLPGGYSAFPSGISENGLIAGQAINGMRTANYTVDAGREAGLHDYMLSGVRLAAHAAGVSAATRWVGVSARPGRILAR
jgi:hypothetical protein